MLAPVGAYRSVRAETRPRGAASYALGRKRRAGIPGASYPGKTDGVWKEKEDGGVTEDAGDAKKNRPPKPVRTNINGAAAARRGRAGFLARIAKRLRRFKG
jgi:hypothetical protein